MRCKMIKQPQDQLKEYFCKGICKYSNLRSDNPAAWALYELDKENKIHCREKNKEKGEFMPYTIEAHAILKALEYIENDMQINGLNIKIYSNNVAAKTLKILLKIKTEKII